MKIFPLLPIATVITAPLAANDAFEVIDKTGVLRFSDGSSIYNFEKDGKFYLEPISISGRTIEGEWKREDNFFIITGVWSWLNGFSQPDDIRTMRLHVTPTDEHEIVGYRKVVVTKVYFVIESIQKN